MQGIIEPTAGKIESYVKSNPKALDMGVMNTAVPWAMATMEYSSAMGVVLCAPTGGSAGIFPGAVLGVANHLGLSMDEKIQVRIEKYENGDIKAVMGDYHNIKITTKEDL